MQSHVSFEEQTENPKKRKREDDEPLASHMHPDSTTKRKKNENNTAIIQPPTDITPTTAALLTPRPSLLNTSLVIPQPVTPSPHTSTHHYTASKSQLAPDSDGYDDEMLIDNVNDQ
jgi:hypothetical protein